MNKFSKFSLYFAFIALSSVTFSGCVATSETNGTKSAPSPLTHGNVQLTLKQGVTTQHEVLEAFGPPNITTIDGEGNEVWTYQKQATVSSSNSSSVYGTIILFGGRSQTSGFEQSSKTMTLIIKFDAKKKVIDFKSMTSNF